MKNAPQQPPKKRGRPPSAPEDVRKVRTVRLNDERWQKLRQLGGEWLERVIDRARPQKGSAS